VARSSEGIVFLICIPTENMDKVAGIYEEKFMDLDIYDTTYDTFSACTEDDHAKILEIGCWPGNITRYLLSKRPNWDIEAIDVAPNMVTLAQKNNPTAQCRVMDCREIDLIEKKFDAIMCGFCMPYLSREDSSRLVKDCSDLLKDGWILYLSTIEGDYSDSGFETGSTGNRAYVYYHSEQYLQELLDKNNFENISLQRKEYQWAIESSSTHIIFLARKVG
jgi:SAM-dependent methyltransferase